MLFIEQTVDREMIAVEGERFAGRKQPMTFNQFVRVFQSNFAQITAAGRQLYVVDMDRQSLWDTYLESFPAGAERQSHNCNACRSFIKNYGHIVTINVDYNLQSIWDFAVDDPMWQSVINNMRDLVYCCTIRDVFIPESQKLGFRSNIQRVLDPTTQKLVNTIEWEHLYLEVPRSYVTGRTPQEYRDPRNVFKRALDEFDTQTVQIVLDLVDQGLYKGVEYKNALETFLQEQQTFISTVLTPPQVDNYLWVAAQRVGIGVAKIRNSAIGTLLIDISKDVDLDIAVRKYESVVAPQNYRRTTAMVSQRQITEAEKTAVQEGLIDSLARRYAVQEDISANDVLWLNRSLASEVKSVFGLLKQDTPADPKKLTKIAEVTIDDFLNNILPKSTSVDILLENKHTNNLFSLIAPTNSNAKPLTRWANNFSWYYTGDVTDSIIKRNVEKAGGSVTGVLRFSIMWNESGNNNIDFDAHAEIEGGSSEHIYFRTYRGRDVRYRSPASGILDVDIIHPDGEIAVENIVYHDLAKMPEGIYHFYVNNFESRNSNGGFSAEIEYDGVIYKYHYSADLRPEQNITVAKFVFNKTTGIQFIESLESNSTVQSKEVWGLTTNTWQPVSVALLSPNYWHNGDQKGNKHFFFVLEKALNNDPVVRGFYNEFLVESLYPHRKVFEILGRRLLVEPSQQQLSGLGFSSTLRNDFLVRVIGASQRVLRVKV